jgi:hypothetical protein
LAFGVAFGGAVDDRGAPALGTEAHATTSILMTLDELVRGSEQVAIVEPLERTSRWEELAGSRRIVTYTKLRVDETIAGKERAEVWVRTLGGTVDKIGQAVAGEASFTLGERSVVFIGNMDGVPVVTGLAQGHFPLTMRGSDIVLASSPDPGNLLKRKAAKTSARDELVGTVLDEAVAKIKTAAAAPKK